MNPNFALSLSHEGIILSHRRDGVWQEVCRVDPFAETLADDLADMRARAKSMAPDGIGCKLVIPENQIRYLVLSTPGMDRSERFAAARAALDGATPYKVADLVIDIALAGDETHVAAVAQETLQEAENFARLHAFPGLCFTADPASGYPGEPFFGEISKPPVDAHSRETDNRQQSSSAAGETIDLAPEPSDAADATFWRDDDDAPKPSFVSRRRVPTFRTEQKDPPPARPIATPTVAQRRQKIAKPLDGQVGVALTKSASNSLTRKASTPFPPIGAPPPKRRTRAVAVVAGFAALLAVGATVLVSRNSDSGFSALMAKAVAPQPQTPFTKPEDVTFLIDIPTAKPAPDMVNLASLETSLTEEDAAILDALRAPAVTEKAAAAPSDNTDLRAAYAASGIWPLAPAVPEPPTIVDIDDLYVTGIDTINPNFDAVALPAVALSGHDLNFSAPASPAPFGTVFDLNEKGLVVATEAGSLNPDGVLVYLGAPPERQPQNMLKTVDTQEDLSARLQLAAYRPQARPGDLVEAAERAAFAGLTRNELGQFRPRLRPESAQEAARASASLVRLDDSSGNALLTRPNGTGIDAATSNAIAASLRPDARPSDFDTTVKTAREIQEKQATKRVAVASTAAVAPRVVRPSIPSNASVAREATIKNAINLRKVNLIGVYGKPSSRRALVRLSNGRYRKVEVGDRIDGGRVSAIGDSELRYQKSGRAVVLKMPRG